MRPAEFVGEVPSHRHAIVEEGVVRTTLRWRGPRRVAHRLALFRGCRSAARSGLLRVPVQSTLLVLSGWVLSMAESLHSERWPL